MKFQRFILLGVITLVHCTPVSEKIPLSPRVNHVMLYVSDLNSSIEFYSRAFGLEVTNRLKSLRIEQPDGSMSSVEIDLAFLKFPGQDFVYEMAEGVVEDSIGRPSHFQHVGFDVEDIETALQMALDAGGELVSPVRLVEGNNVAAKTAFVKGPDGEFVELMQMISGEF